MFYCWLLGLERVIKKGDKMKIFKVVLIILSVGCLVGCTGHPVPQEAFKICSEQDGRSLYVSGYRGTKFACVLAGDELEGAW